MDSFERISDRSICLYKNILGHGLSIKSVQEIDMLLLQRSNRVTDDNMRALGKILPTKIPLQVCKKTESIDGTVTILSVEPDVWFLLCSKGKGEALATILEEKGGALTIKTAMMSDQYSCIDVTGICAPAVLAKGSSLDIRHEVFLDNDCARTLLARINIVLWRIDDGFRFIFDVSLETYIWRWLNEVSAEFCEQLA